MNNCFLVPIHLDALLSNGSPVKNQMTDYTQLPYLNDEGVQNDGIAYISDRIRSQMVFADAPNANLYNLSLEPGLHLHWALPDALTVGKQQEGKLIFPRVPNRWLISRRGGGRPEKQWVIESDYFAPIEQGNPENSISVYILAEDSESRQSQENYHREQPWRYMGRKLTLEDWKSRELTAEYAQALSVIGPMNRVRTMDTEKASFAAFYPNCRSVFGFCDPEITPQETLSEEMEYEVVGWYSDRNQDYLREWLGEWQEYWQKELERKEAEAQLKNDIDILSLEAFIKTLKEISEQEPIPPTNSLVMQLYQALLQLCEGIKEYNDNLPKFNNVRMKFWTMLLNRNCLAGILFLPKFPTYTLEPTSAPRYWQPNNPVVLMVGEGIEPTPRHGQDSEGSAEGLIGCKIVADNFDLENLPDATLNSLRKAIDSLAAETQEQENIGLFTWNGTPWNPFLLEWLVQYFPNLKNPATNEGEGMQKFKGDLYGENYISKNYQLEVGHVDLSFKEGRQNSFLKPSPQEGAASHYRGFSILTPHALPMLQDKLKRLLITSYCQAKAIPSPEEIDEELTDYFQAQEDQIKAWVNSLSLEQYPGVQTAIAALEKLKNLKCLSQSY